MESIIGNLMDSQLTGTSSQTINFGAEGNCKEFVVAGWSVPESGFRWMVGVDSELRFHQRFGNGDYIIEFELSPFVRPPIVLSQRLTVSVNGMVIGHSTVTRGGRFGYRIPVAALIDRETTSIVLHHPDAARPCDFGDGNDARSLSMVVKRLRVSQILPGASGLRIDGASRITLADLELRIGMAADKFILNFESLGDNCEFGLVQRRCGAEPLGLLRFSNIELRTLLHGLDMGFQDFGDSNNIQFRLENTERPEYIVQEKRYGIVYHTFRYKGEVDEEKLISGEPGRLAFLVRKFVEDLRGGHKIFVCKRNMPLLEDEILPLYAALNSYARNVLLWVVPADGGHVSGSVEIVMPGLLKAFIERFAPPENAHDLMLDAWLEICVNAYRLSRMNPLTGVSVRFDDTGS